jgi:hypothetical protein
MEKPTKRLTKQELSVVLQFLIVALWAIMAIFAPLKVTYGSL